MYLLSPRHPHVEKSSHSSHPESLVFKQPPPLEPPMSSPPPSLRDPPWPHGGTPPGRPSPSDRPSTQSQRKDFSLAPAVPGHRIPRPYNKVASSECKRRDLAHLENVNVKDSCSSYHMLIVSHVDLPNNRISWNLVFLCSERECDLDKHCGVLDPDRKKVCTRLLTCNVSSPHYASPSW